MNRFALMALLLAAPAACAHGDKGSRRFDPAKVEVTDFGRQGDPKRVTRTIKVEMSDAMRFTPADITVRQGETLRFVVANRGKLLHEMVLGTPQAIAEHAELMKKFPDMEHDDPHIAHVKPGRSGAIVWQFSKAGEFRFACLQPGHYEAGMVGKLVVQAPAAMAEAEVRKVDKAQGKLTLRHGPIANLEMPAMTMVFRVADPKLLDAVKEGDKIRFAAEKLNGLYTVTAIEAAR